MTQFFPHLSNVTPLKPVEFKKTAELFSPVFALSLNAGMELANAQAQLMAQTARATVDVMDAAFKAGQAHLNELGIAVNFNASVTPKR